MTGSVWGQCTITQPTITNASVSAGIANFSLTFKHDRNWGNKWVTVHLWKNTDYPNYDYDRVPTTTRLGGASKRPFGTVIINNDMVDHSGTYTNAQAFAAAYQNDGTFVMINTSSSSLVYNESTDTYTLNNLQCVLPAGTTILKYDSWSSQSSNNWNVHCFSCNGGTIIVPTVLGVTYQKPFKASLDGDMVQFGWTTSSESNNSHFVLEHLMGSEWKDVATIFCNSENGFSDQPISYSYRMPVKGDQRPKQMMIGLGVLMAALSIRRFVPARLTILLFMAGACAFGGCDESDAQESLQQDHFFRLRQVDRDGKFTHTASEMVKF